MGKAAKNNIGFIKCIFCGNPASLERYRINYEINLGNPHYLFIRRYSCKTCGNGIEIDSIEKTHNISDLLERDKAWAENLK